MTASKLGTFEEAFFLEPKEDIDEYDEFDDAEFEEDLDFGLVQRELLADKLERAYVRALGDKSGLVSPWLAVADAAVAIILEEV